MDALSLSLCVLVVLAVCVIAGWHMRSTHPVNPYYEKFHAGVDPSPLVVYQTIDDKKKIPPKVFYNIKAYAPEYRHVIFDDNECEDFLFTYMGPIYRDRFRSLRLGCHKADLFRYCLLFLRGGVYLDIKTELILPLREVFPDRTKVYTAIQAAGNGIYQGILASPPMNPLFLDLANYILHHDPRHYSEYLEDFYERIKQYPKENLVLYHEHCAKNPKDCGGLDRYGLCCYIMDGRGERIVKTRFNDYPW